MELHYGRVYTIGRLGFTTLKAEKMLLKIIIE